MGDFRIIIDATGGHGCQREVKDGGTVYGCRQQGCPDCVAQEFFEKMSKIASNCRGTFTHWPGSTAEVVDEFKASVHEVKTYTIRSLDGNSPNEGKEQAYVGYTPPHRIRSGSF
jgi:hypothetical protein